MYLSRLLGLTLAVSVVASAAIANNALASNANGSLTGAGSTLVAPLMTNWAQDFEARNSISVTYGAVGSGTGIAQITARTVDFGASDAPLTAAQATACNGCLQIPWALTATVLAFHVNSIRTLRLTPAIISRIYLGHIKNWNDAQIAKINPKVKLPNLAITPAYRSDGSGDTYAFTDWMSRASGSSWKTKIGNATSVSFPYGVGGKGNDGVSAVIGTTNGAIGYISAAYALTHGLAAAALQNRAGRYEYPNLVNISAAAAAFPRVPANNEMHIVNPPKSAKSAYPLSTYSYAMVPRVSKNGVNLKKFVQYAISANGQKFGAALDFAPLPRSVFNAALATSNQLQAG